MAAVDLGAESGRVVAATFDGRRLALDVQGRFPNGASVVDGLLRWDVDGLWGRVGDHLAALAARTEVASVGVDTWGVDYGLLRADGTLVDQPTCYRDPRQGRAMRAAVERVGVERLYTAAGTQTIEINTVFGLMDDAAHTRRLDEAATFLMIPDVFHHRLSGTLVTERTAASTTGLFRLDTHDWARDLASELGIPDRLFPEVVAAGSDLGPVTGPLADRGLARTRVITPTGHDTAAAVAATPFATPGGLFISSGTGR